ncbi:hypothetical protein ZWY2020_040996 [Hordeum vulgare]|nr:hypothetical protein ZWY2020_040996 [Hordeum vulgare]
MLFFLRREATLSVSKSKISPSSTVSTHPSLRHSSSPPPPSLAHSTLYPPPVPSPNSPAPSPGPGCPPPPRSPPAPTAAGHRRPAPPARIGYPLRRLRDNDVGFNCCNTGRKYKWEPCTKCGFTFQPRC